MVKSESNPTMVRRTRMSKVNLVGVHLVVEQLHAPDQYMPFAEWLHA